MITTLSLSLLPYTIVEWHRHGRLVLVVVVGAN
jgi:hypothetical protein